MKRLFFILITAFIGSATAQVNEDSSFIRKIYDEALENGHAYENLRSLCKDVGHRITGSAEAKMAVQWGRTLLNNYEFHNVYLQEIKVPHWERGNKEAGWMIAENGQVSKLCIIALGGSVGTGGLIEGDVVAVSSIEELKLLGEDKVKDKIIFYNRPFDQKHINTFRAYGGCIDQRWQGTSEAAKLGAKGVIIRSLSTPTDTHPHTGSMWYEEGVEPIAGAAISTVDADLLNAWLEKGKVSVKMELDCRTFPDEISYNVIAEEKGHEDDKIITFGGHLDSWDVGEGAHDDGAGVIHCIEAMRILKKLGYVPNHTLRLVLFMNEENGNWGGKHYAEISFEHKEEHLAAIESDRGGFLPIGFDIVGNIDQVEEVRGFTQEVLKDFELYRFNPGYGGVDIGPLKQYYPEMVQFGMAINSQKYFHYHHAETDVFENVDKRELELGAAALAALIYLVDQNM